MICQRADRLVENYLFRFHGLRARDADALPLAAAEFMRIPLGVGEIKPDGLQ